MLSSINNNNCSASWNQSVPANDAMTPSTRTMAVVARRDDGEEENARQTTQNLCVGVAVDVTSSVVDFV